MEKVFERIPHMKMRETVELWRNALRILSDRNKRKQHQAAARVIKEIGREWERRRRAPVDPSEMFRWPGTEADRGSGDLDTSEWIKEGALQYLGYKVGNTDGEIAGVRERILSEMFKGPIPPVFPKVYLDQWSAPSSPARLQKLAETIAALTRNAKRRRDSRMQAAIRDWERDLEYLYMEYYVGKFCFAWPVSAV